ncbi:MAG: hypothetical protein J5643_07810 [Lachnospiraceae bacterium]|nr:hypothetical protein [Lachnospiraceae bacterium]
MTNTLNQNLLLRSLRIDWDEIGRDSYLREIPAIAELQEFDFDHSVTFFVENRQQMLKRLLEETE